MGQTLILYISDIHSLPQVAAKEDHQVAIFEAKGLTKRYGNVGIEDVSFSLEPGIITGFIGANGAGKTTTMKCALNVVHPDAGEVTAFGLSMRDCEEEIKSRVAFATGGFDYYPYCRAGKVAKMISEFYPVWRDDVYKSLIAKFGLDENKRIRDFSAGMKVKFSLALALSHEAEVLFLDEPTSGLDPLARDELLDVFRSVAYDRDKSILFSTHVTSDLDKCADKILIIRDGKIISDSTRDELIDGHVIIRGGADELTDEIKAKAVGYKTNAYSFSALVKRGETSTEGFVTEKPDLEDVMIYYYRRAGEGDTAL